VGPRTQAIVPVHLFGQVAPMEQLVAIARSAGVPLVEDAAQAQGARQQGRAAGTFGVVAGTSFYPGKNLGAAGDAGGVLTDDAEVARTVRVLSAHGSPRKYDHELIGVNSRLDTVQAVVLEAKLRRLDAWNAARRAAADRYAQLLADVPGVTVPTSAAGNEDIWHLYVVQVDERDRVLAELGAAGIGVGIHYPTPVHLTQAYAGLGLDRGAFPVTEAAADRILSLPMFPHLTADQQEQVVAALAAAVSGRTVPPPTLPVGR
jgi:dTDP-4-amino-4,6-dideoxygalactose transaminase